MRENKIKLIIFDFDGTIADSKSTWKKDIIKVLRYHGYPGKAEAIAHNALVVGKRLDEAMKPLKLKRNKEDAYRLEIYKEFIDGIGKMKLCPGFNSLKKIKQKKMIVSNAQEFLIREFMKKKKITIFSKLYGAGDFKKKYKKIRDIVKAEGLKKSEVIYVGDRETDVSNARKAGVVSIGIANGCNFGGKEEMIRANPDFLVKDLGEIRKIVS